MTDEQQQVDVNLFNIVISLSQAAMMGLGKISNPHTGNIENNMDIAKINIDILQMLKDKTVGNLTMSGPAERPAPQPSKPVRASSSKVGRNDPCPCGSGKKYKKCCGS